MAVLPHIVKQCSIRLEPKTSQTSLLLLVRVVLCTYIRLAAAVLGKGAVLLAAADGTHMQTLTALLVASESSCVVEPQAQSSAQHRVAHEPLGTADAVLLPVIQLLVDALLGVVLDKLVVLLMERVSCAGLLKSSWNVP